MERRSDGALLGIAGLNRLRWDPGEIEVGWRLLPSHRGQDLATEAGRAWIGHAFGTLGASRVISVSDLPNHASQAVMRRLGTVVDHHATLKDGEDEFGAVIHAISRETWEA